MFTKDSIGGYLVESEHGIIILGHLDTNAIGSASAWLVLSAPARCANYTIPAHPIQYSAAPSHTLYPNAMLYSIVRP